ncbi:MAG: hypothetical protein ACREDK_03845 [Thermoplasmata archaeon]
MVSSESGDERPGGDVTHPVLDHLLPEQLRTLAYASAIGREFDFPLLVAAMGADEEPLAEQLERLTHVGILRERPGGDRFAFVDDEVRARIYQSLTASRLRVLHRKIAEAMEHRYPDPPPEILPELGRHFFLGRIPEKSHDYNRRAAGLARQDDAPEIAAHHLERARIDLRSLKGPRALEEAELDADLGDLYYIMGEVHAADHLFAEAMERAGDGDARLKARLLLARAEVARELPHHEAAVASARAAREIYSQHGDLVGVANVHRLLGRIAYQKGAYRDALDEEMRALDLAQDLHDPRLLGRVCIDIGNTFSLLGPDVRAEAAPWYARAIGHLSEAGDSLEVARAYLEMSIEMGDRDPAGGLEGLAKSREFAERGHEPRSVGRALASGIEMHLALGQVDEGERDNDHARRIFERSDYPLGILRCDLNSGTIAERRGQWEDAERWFTTALGRARAIALDDEIATAQFYLARLWFKTRDIPRARAAIEEAGRLHVAERRPHLARAYHELVRELASTPESPVPEISGEAAPAPHPSIDGRE